MAGAVEVYGGRGPLVLAVTWSLFSICTILLLMRLYVKFGMKRPGRWPLIWVLIAWTLNFITQIVATVGIRKYGIGNHIEIVGAAGVLARTLVCVWISSAVAVLGIGAGKVAAVMLVLDIQGNTRRKGRILLLAIAVINMVGNIIIAISVWFQCDPPHKLWDVEAPGKCNNKFAVQVLSMTISAVSGASDFIIALYPALIIWQLKIDIRLKLGLSMLMSLGLFTGACAIIKVTTLPAISNASDPTYAIAKLLLWGYTESWVVLIVTLIPATYPIRHAFSNRPSTYGTSRSRSGHVHLSGDELGPGIRGDHKSAYKGRSFVDHGQGMPDGSTSELPLNDIVMKQDVQIKREYTTAHIMEMPTTTSHSRSRSSDLHDESYLED